MYKILEMYLFFKPYLINGLGTKEHENELKNKFPEIYPNLEKFSKDCNSYLSFIDDCGIIDDFNKYIIIDKLDK